MLDWRGGALAPPRLSEPRPGRDTDHAHDSPESHCRKAPHAGHRAAAHAFRRLQELPRRARAAQCQPVALSGPGHRADRRERRRQVDAGQDPHRHLPAGRRRDQRRRRACQLPERAQPPSSTASPPSTRRPCCSTISSVAENIFLGHAPRTRFGTIDWKTMRANAREVLDTMHAGHIDADARLRDLGIANKHLVAVARAMSIDAQIVIMDEPTAALSAQGNRGAFPAHRIPEERGQGDPLHQPQVRRDLPHRRPLHRVSRRRDGGRGDDCRRQPERDRQADGRPRRRPHLPASARPISARRCLPSPTFRIRPSSTTSPSSCARARSSASTGWSAPAAAR